MKFDVLNYTGDVSQKIANRFKEVRSICCIEDPEHYEPITYVDRRLHQVGTNQNL